MPSPRGLRALLGNTFFRVYRQTKKLSLNNDYSRYRMEYSSTPLQIGKRFMWSGEIPVAKPHAYGVIGRKNANADYVKDEGVLIYKSDLGLIIFIGCGHRGLMDIVRHCQSITGINHIHAIFGGFHLRSASPVSSGQSGSFYTA
jgi:7,8-dihydropterin-6-yl-methyl-4-(beta-D-ribofuranosyl)aminobenzene 5'-phosphate synthase